MITTCIEPVVEPEQLKKLKDWNTQNRKQLENHLPVDRKLLGNVTDELGKIIQQTPHWMDVLQKILKKNRPEASAALPSEERLIEKFLAPRPAFVTKKTKKAPGRPRVDEEKKARNFTLCLAPKYLQFLDQLKLNDKDWGRGRKIRYIIDEFIELKNRQRSQLQVLREVLLNVERELKTLAGEGRAREAKKALGRGRLYAPRLMGYELAHVAVKKIGKQPEQKEDILKALDLALRLDIQWVEVDLSAVAKLAVSKSLTAYDASYLYVSASLGIPLLTFDEKLLSRSVK